jgi:hypothetical protein
MSSARLDRVCAGVAVEREAAEVRLDRVCAGVAVEREAAEVELASTSGANGLMPPRYNSMFVHAESG